MLGINTVRPQTFFADHARSFEVALVGDEDDGPCAANTGCRHSRVAVTNAREDVGGFLVGAAVSDGVDDNVAMHVILLPHLQVLCTPNDRPALTDAILSVERQRKLKKNVKNVENVGKKLNVQNAIKTLNC